jgi:hypothetical protein
MTYIIAFIFLVIGVSTNNWLLIGIGIALAFFNSRN